MEHDKGQLEAPPAPPKPEEPKPGGRDSKGRFVGGNPGRPPGSGKGKGKARPEAKLQELQAELEETMQDAAGWLAPWAPVTADIWLAKEQRAVANLLALARRYPRFAASLESGGTIMAFVGLGSFVGAVAFAVGVDLGRLSPEGPFQDRMGITEAYHRYYSEEGEGGAIGPGPGGNGDGIPAPGFLAGLPGSPSA